MCNNRVLKVRNGDNLHGEGRKREAVQCKSKYRSEFQWVSERWMGKDEGKWLAEGTNTWLPRIRRVQGWQQVARAVQHISHQMAGNMHVTRT